MKRSTSNMIGSKQLWMAAVGIFLLTMACVGSATPSLPTLSSNDVATVVAATMLAIGPQSTSTFAFPSSVPAATPIPPTFPVIVPTSVLPSAARIQFLTGATEGVVSAPIQPGQTLYYVLKALQGQPMTVTVLSVNQDVTLSLTTQGGTSLLSSGAKEASWQGMLPQTEDYYFGIYGGATTENFTLNVNIPSRIKIATGATKAILTGQTVGGYNVTYTAFGFQGQVMALDLTAVGNNAVLAIHGFADGQPYLRYVTEQTSFSMKLPSTQDYIIEVVPRAGMVVGYTLVVKFQ
jgi:hypothetical protein